jgi:hypothetical protein
MATLLQKGLTGKLSILVKACKNPAKPQNALKKL